MERADRAAVVARLRESLADAERVRAELAKDGQLPRIMAEARLKADALFADAPKVMVLKECTSAFDGQGQVIKDKDGKQTIMICQPRIPVTARLGLEQARDEIARDKDIPEDTRKEVLKTLDAQIARWKDKEG